MAGKCLLSLDLDPQPLGHLENGLGRALSLFYDGFKIHCLGQLDQLTFVENERPVFGAVAIGSDPVCGLRVVYRSSSISLAIIARSTSSASAFR
jgi:hypothetical protein